MSRIISCLLAFVCVILSLPCSAQVTQENLEQRMTKAGCLFHSYEFDDVNDTPPPAGFKPFYISHYGRHGSRFHVLEKYFNQDKFKKEEKPHKKIKILIKTCVFMLKVIK